MFIVLLFKILNCTELFDGRRLWPTSYVHSIKCGPARKFLFRPRGNCRDCPPPPPMRHCIFSSFRRLSSDHECWGFVLWWCSRGASIMICLQTHAGLRVPYLASMACQWRVVKLQRSVAETGYEKNKNKLSTSSFAYQSCFHKNAIIDIRNRRRYVDEVMLWRWQKWVNR
jgi:hypothetical protein